MRVLNYLELDGRLERSGIGTAAAHQRQALASTDIEVVTDPWQPTPGRIIAECDLAHVNLFGPGSLAVAQASRRRDTPLIVHAHVTSEDFRNSFRGSNLLAPPLRYYLRWFYSRADRVLCPSKHTKQLLETYPVDAPIDAITNGVDLESLTDHDRLREHYRTKYELEGMVVFAVGNVFERKGLDTFCRLAQRTDYDYAWFGPYDRGPLASRPVRHWVTDPPSNVTFTGWIDDKRGAFGAGDVFLFPTHAENQGIAVLEAMACGKPVVLRDLPVFREYYTDGHDCLLCTSLSEFNDALDRLAANPGLRDRLGENARETAAAHALDRVGARLRDIYRETRAEVITD